MRCFEHARALCLLSVSMSLPIFAIIGSRCASDAAGGARRCSGAELLAVSRRAFQMWKRLK